MLKADAKLVKLLGYSALGLAVGAFGIEQVNLSQGGIHVFNPAFALADSTLALLGLITVTIAECLKKFEDANGKLPSAKNEF